MFFILWAMRNNASENLPSAHLANEFSLEGNVSLRGAKEWLIFLYLVSQLDSMKQDKLPVVKIAVNDLRLVLKNNTKRSGSFYSEVKATMERMLHAYCRFDTDVYLDGIPLPRMINFFNTVSAVKEKDGTTYLTFSFNDMMKPLLLGLQKNFVGLKPPTGMTSGHAINFFVIAKTERDRRRKHDGKTTIIRYGIEELKIKLFIEGKYPRFDNFKKRVISPIQKGVNKSGTILITEIQYEKISKKVSHVLFFVEDAKPVKSSPLQPSTKENTEPTKEEEVILTFAQERAYHFLTDKGIYSGIAIRKIIPQMPSSVCDGYEDYFCEEVYKIVVEKSNVKDIQGRASVLVDWFKKDIFKNDHFSRIIENVHNRKKLLPQENRTNRELAKTMTADKFRELRKNTAKPKPDGVPKPISPTLSKTQFNFTSLENLPFPEAKSKIIHRKNFNKKKTPFEFNNWKRENPAVFNRIVIEKNNSFKELFSNTQMGFEEKEKTIKNLIFAGCKHYYDTH